VGFGAHFDWKFSLAAYLSTVAGEQSHARALSVNDQAVTVMFNFLEPVAPGGNLSSALEGV
jgi:hypothetical protein